MRLTTFEFGSDTNLQHFMNWLVDNGKQFELDGIRVGVSSHQVDETVRDQVRDLGGSYIGVND